MALTFLIFRSIFTYTRAHLSQNRLHLAPFLAIFSFLMLLVLHGASAFKVALILSVNYLIARLCRGSKAGPILTWVFNGLVLFANEKNSGYLFASLHPELEFLVREFISMRTKCVLLADWHGV